MTENKNANEASKPKGISPSIVIILLVVAVFAGVMFAKARSGATATPDATVADYEAALKAGKPIYVLFHSLTCQPCVEISAVVDKVMPGYAGKVVFVNAISDDPSAQQLASRFQFQYIPTSFFITPDGKVADSFTGAMPDADMKARLDKLIAQ